MNDIRIWNIDEKKHESNEKKTKKPKKNGEYEKFLKWYSKCKNDFEENREKEFVRKKNHEMYLQKDNKLAFNAFGDKRKHLNNI